MLSFLHTLNKKLEKIMPFMTPASVILGVLLAPYLHTLTFLVPWVFACMTFAGSLGSNFKDFTRVIMHPIPLITCMLILHVVMPLVALGTGHMLFPGDTMTTTGMLLTMALPTGIISLMWVSIYKGNIAFTLSLILIDTFLSPFIVPYTLHLLVGADVKMDTLGMMEGLLWMVVLPSFIGMLLNQLTKGRVKEKLGQPLAPFSKLGLGVCIAINSSVVAPYLKQFDLKLLGIFVTMLCLAASGYLIGFLVAKLMKWDLSLVTALTFNGGMRNISAGAVLATTYFPAPVAMPVIVCMLFQQILASLFSHLFRERTAQVRVPASSTPSAR